MAAARLEPDDAGEPVGRCQSELSVSGAHGAFADASGYAKNSSLQAGMALRAWEMLPPQYSCELWLDVGCGPATLTHQLFTKLPKPPSRVIGIDLSFEHVIYANQHYPELKVIHGSADDTSLFQRFLAEHGGSSNRTAFELVTCFSTLHWLSPDEQVSALRNFASVLQPGTGRLVLAHFAGIENRSVEAGKIAARSSPELLQYLEGHLEASKAFELHQYYFDATTNNGVKDTWSARLTDCGFAVDNMEIYEHQQEFSVEGLLGFMRPLNRHLPLLPEKLRPMYEEQYLQAMKELGGYDKPRDLYILRSRIVLAMSLRI